MRAMNSEKKEGSSMFTLEQLEQLLAIERDQTLSRAARSLAVSQPTLTRSMQALERALGVPLFSRTKNQIILNEAGKKTTAFARDVLKQCEQFQNELADTPIRIGSLAPMPLEHLRKQIQQANPRRAVEAKMADGNTLLRGLEEGSFDQIILDAWPRTKRFSCKVFETETLFILVKQGHRFWNRQTIDFETLNGETMLLNAQIGSWESLVREKMPDSTFLMQTDSQALNVVRRHSSLPSFVSNFTPYTLASNERMIPLVDSEATKTFLLVTR